ncbi:hypothetical protein V494_04585 [Pseudogymnoascus sp. VKM F-4513 (FW-928)]|nr:hypothetical protein V494_04585 [Pseudogymnoascus sp. VKM F-4513 (FW-928)]
MQFSTLAVVLFASLATARSHGHGQRFQHRRGFNESSSAVDLTTLTVQITSTHTVVSCAQNVTDCPATATRTVTEVVDLTTTVCPVASASDISKSVIASASQTPGSITSTEAAEPIQTSDSVLTYTLGTGSTQSVVTTTIKHTVTGYVTKYMTKSADAQATPAVGGGQANVGGNDKSNDNAGGNGIGSGNDSSDEPTTTIRSTTTATRTITVKPSKSAGPGTGSFIGNENNNAGSGGNGGDCAAPVTVTVALSTVTVTYTHLAKSPFGPGYEANKEAVQTSAPSVVAPEAPATTPKPTDGAAPEEPVTIVTIPVIPVPYKNSTETATKGRHHHHPSGFMTVPKPTGTGSSIKPVRTGWF